MTLRFKATEFRKVLLYTGIFTLKGILVHQYHKHLLELSVAMRIIPDHDNGYRNKCLDYTKDLLVCFVNNPATLYGESFVTYNVHGLIHLPDDANHFQVSLDKKSFFSFSKPTQNSPPTQKICEKSIQPPS